ncbi:MAG TPA: hypothetical protein DIC64_02055 [Alphaproteobacteria bacterium]|nr:hypothetical protein [Alphaproteobacteria bacterium]
MNKYFLAALLSVSVLSFQANAENIYTPYIGIDGIYNKAKANHFRPQYYGANINLGTTYNKYFGTEIFYTQVGSETKKVNSVQKYKTSYRAYGIDLIATAPLFQNFGLTAGAGIATYILSEKRPIASHSSDEGFGYRFSAGFVYDLNQNVALRGRAGYINFDHISNADHMAEYVFGIRYKF